MRKLSYWILTCAEKLYLYAHGWTKLDADLGTYTPPVDFPFKKHPSYGRVHAVNAQRQTYAEQKPTP